MEIIIGDGIATHSLAVTVSRSWKALFSTDNLRERCQRNKKWYNTTALY